MLQQKSTIKNCWIAFLYSVPCLSISVHHSFHDTTQHNTPQLHNWTLNRRFYDFKIEIKSLYVIIIIQKPTCVCLQESSVFRSESKKYMLRQFMNLGSSMTNIYIFCFRLLFFFCLFFSQIFVLLFVATLSIIPPVPPQSIHWIRFAEWSDFLCFFLLLFCFSVEVR